MLLLLHHVIFLWPRSVLSTFMCAAVVYVLQATVQSLNKCIQWVFFSRVVLLSEGSWTHTRFCSSSAYSIRPFYWVMGIPQVSQWNCFPPYSPVSLKIASPTDTECVGKLFINFNIRVTVTGFIRYISIICGIAFFIQGELNRWVILCRYCCPLFRTLHVRQTWQDWFLNIEHFLSFGVNAL